ncbi:MAG: acyl-CoA reductase [Bacteroidota bacterium]
MDIRTRIQTFIETGRMLSRFPLVMDNGTAHPMEEPALRAREANPWFTPENIRFALNALGESMTALSFDQWLEPYMSSLGGAGKVPKIVGVVTAGNIPLAGFHDFMSVLLCGHIFCGKLSGQDKILLPAVAAFIEAIHPGWKDRIRFTDVPFKQVDAIIATGSDNTHRYFEYYFSRYPHIIRKNRNGVAVLNGDESEDELNGLAMDVMLYFGLGCRSVSKIYIPQDYDVMRLLPYFEPWNELIRHNKYFNNYEYQKSIRIVNRKPYYDFGNLLLNEESRLVSPVSVLNFGRYNDLKTLSGELRIHSDQIQCVVSATDPGMPCILPGTAQKPELWEYADGIDTVRFLINEI